MGYHTSVEAILRIKLIFSLNPIPLLVFTIPYQPKIQYLVYMICDRYFRLCCRNDESDIQNYFLRWQKCDNTVPCFGKSLKQEPTIQAGNKICFDGCMHLRTFQWHKQHIDHATVCIKWWMHHSTRKFVCYFSFVSFCLFCNCGLAIPTCITARALRTCHGACRNC